MKGTEVQLGKKTAATKHLPNGLAPVGRFLFFCFPLPGLCLTRFSILRLSETKRRRCPRDAVPYRLGSTFSLTLLQTIRRKKREERKSLSSKKITWVKFIEEVSSHWDMVDHIWILHYAVQQIHQRLTNSKPQWPPSCQAPGIENCLIDPYVLGHVCPVRTCTWYQYTPPCNVLLWF